MLHLKTLSMTALFLVSIQVCFAQSQYDLTASSLKDLQKAEKDLNAVYQKVLAQYKTDTAFTRYLKTAQRLWLQLRDADLDAMYPPDPLGGSAGPMCYNNSKAAVTIDRTKYLKQWLEGRDEGDVCGGSIKSKD
ncbi:lysozyme inhibitor LprI family protein [Chitinophaga sp. YIM B06452]|uniref:lysozyme inhibitor LprI family protein n=1 Tax=Chitinophaga sp. YIM B06452 TaxID=3082158 RepID=UPI0031FE9763